MFAFLLTAQKSGFFVSDHTIHGKMDALWLLAQLNFLSPRAAYRQECTFFMSYSKTNFTQFVKHDHGSTSYFCSLSV